MESNCVDIFGASRVQVLVGLLLVRILLLNVATLLATLPWLFAGIPQHVDIGGCSELLHMFQQKHLQFNVKPLQSHEKTN